MSTQVKTLQRRLLVLVVFAVVPYGWLYFALGQNAPKEKDSGNSEQAQSRTNLARTHPSPDTGVISFRARDFETGFSVPATFVVQGAEQGRYPPHTFSSDEFGRLRLPLTAGYYLYEVSAPGYKPLRSYFQIAPAFPQNQDDMLDPISPPEEEQMGMIDSKLRPGYTLIYGYISDSKTGKPLANVSVHVEKAQADATTNERGYFELSVESPRAEMRRGVPFPGLAGIDNISISLKGYKKYDIQNTDLVEGETSGWKLDLQRGEGVEQHDYMHKLRRAAEGIKEPEEPQSAKPGPALPLWLQKRLRDWMGTAGRGASIHKDITETISDPLTITVPNQIVVGSNCPSGGNGEHLCTAATTYALESYVQQGLEGEWYSYWDPNSLKAGAVAYRSYGAWFVTNKVCPQTGVNGCTQIYDICNTTSCQAFAPKSKPAAATKSAAVATAGTVLTSDSVNVFKAEYSAENNAVDALDGNCTNPDWDICGNGYVGSPLYRWPCMKDWVCSEYRCNGHGRGMCQDGSQRWARGKDDGGNVITTPRSWQCILDHYYNDNGNSTGAGTDLRTVLINGPGGDGKLAFANGGAGQGQEVYTMNPDASNLFGLRSTKSINPSTAAWSPDGDQIVLSAICPSGTGGCLFKVNADGTNMTQLTSYPGPVSGGDGFPSWSPSGNGRIVFMSNRDPSFNSSFDIWAINQDFSNLARLTLHANAAIPGWSPDGAKIIFEEGIIALYCGPTYQSSQFQLFVMNADGTSPSQLTFPPDSISETPSWSPDGKKIALARGDGCFTHEDIWIMNSDGTSPQQLTSVGTNTFYRFPRWSPDGSKIVFLSTDQTGETTYVMNADGTNPTPLTIINPQNWDAVCDWTRCSGFDGP